MVEYNARKASTLPMIDTVDATDKIMVINDGAPPDVVLAPMDVLAQYAGSFAPAGPQGIQGIQGPQGTPGTDLAVQGSVPTQADLAAIANPVDGQTYVTADTGQLWVYDSGPPVSWTAIATAIGPKGETGATGATGPAGPAGPQGNQGPAGIGIAGANVPVGTVLDFVGVTAPTGFLLCDGGEYPSANYPQLSALFVGSQWPQAQTVGYFKVPLLNGRMTVGVDPVDAFFGFVGKSGGTKNLVNISHDHPAGTLAMTSHDHTVDIWSGWVNFNHAHAFSTGNGSANHTHGWDAKAFIYNDVGESGYGLTGTGGLRSAVWSADGANHTHSGTTAGVADPWNMRVPVNGTTGAKGGAVTGTTSPSGVAGTNLNVPPYTVMTKIIRATV
jgi:hypothetical protein